MKPKAEGYHWSYAKDYDRQKTKRVHAFSRGLYTSLKGGSLMGCRRTSMPSLLVSERNVGGGLVPMLRSEFERRGWHLFLDQR